MKLQVFISLIICIQSKAIVNHHPSKPGCPGVIQPMQNFFLDRFVGVWYEIQKYSSQFGLGTCNSMNLRTVRDGNGSTVLIRYTQKLGGIFSDFDQSAPIVGLINSVWQLQYNRSLNVDIDGYIYILETDFNNYAVVFACGIINKRQNGQMAWILSRSRSLQPMYLNRSLEVLRANKLDLRALIPSDQSSCNSELEAL